MAHSRARARAARVWQGAARRALNIRPGELRLVAVLGCYVFLTTAAVVVLSSLKNGLFLSVYNTPEFIPYVIIASALVSATFAVGFAGLVGVLSRPRLGEVMALVWAGSLVVGRVWFAFAPGIAFVLYLWVSVVGVLAVTQAWGTIGDLLTGRQAKRLLALVASGGSMAGMLAGFGLTPATRLLGTPNLLLLAAALLLAPVPLMRLAPEAGSVAAGVGRRRSGHTFAESVHRGFRALGEERLLGLVALAVFLTMVISTVVDYQFKATLQVAFTRDQITSIYGTVAGAVGLGSFLLQTTASRLLVQHFGVSAGSLTQAGAIGGVAASLFLFGGFKLLMVLRFLDDAIRFSLQRTVEQVSLTPYPPAVKGPAYATISGVIRPVSQAAAGGLLILFAPRLGVNNLSLLTMAAAGGMVALFVRYQAAYLAALEQALLRRTLNLAAGVAGGLPMLDRNAYRILDRALADADAGVVVFAISLLRGAPVAEARPRLLPLLEHPVPEVRAEAATALADVEEDAGPNRELRPLIARLAVETSPVALQALLAALAGAEDAPLPALAPRFLGHPDAGVRREALIALARHDARTGSSLAREKMRELLASGDTADRNAALGAVAALREASALPAVVAAVVNPATRTAALDALAALGPAALPAFDELLGRPDLELPARRALLTALSSLDDRGARDRLLAWLREPELMGAALTCLVRLRRAGRLPPLETGLLRPLLEAEVRQGLRHELLAAALRDGGAPLGRARARQTKPDPERASFVAGELAGLHRRAAHRVIALLSLGYDPARLEAVYTHLFAEDAAQRSNALELLEGLLPPPEAALVLLLVDAAPVQDRVAAAGRLAPDTRRVLARPLEALAAEREPWVRACAAFLMDSDGAAGGEARRRREAHPLTEEERGMIPVIEKVMVLKGSSLFRTLPGDELLGVARVAEDLHLPAGEVLFREGDPGDAFYVVLTGSVRIDRGGRRIALLGAREGLGEMALLDREPRSATATAAEPTTLLRIDRDSFDALVDRNPAIARGIYRVLSQRLRATLGQVGEAPAEARGTRP
ncbi:MAG: cyclic nucleotide-binding domain-containing protein [Gemmatimonadetes bacterium]|nr:cyclic nucleotide-binding domain-containing protein [Gemmatimonadota bacterium]